MERYLLLVFSILLTCSFAIAQDGINYQGAATDANGDELITQNISIRASVLSGSANGTLEWEENHSTTTDQFGLFNVVIGQGSNASTGATANFNDIDWGSADHFLKIEMDASGGTNYAMIGTTQMMSVPYALYAKSAGNSESNQTFSVSTNGDTLFISDGNFVLVPGISNTNYPSSPEANFSTNLIIITEGESVVFFDNSTNNPTSWTWDFGDGNTSTDQNPTHFYLTPGTYSVSLTATNSYGYDTFTQNDLIIVNDASIAQFADFGATPTNITEGNLISFTDLSTNYPTSWYWEFGDGNSSTDQNPTNTYNSSGIYSVMLVADNDTTVKDNYIYVSGVASMPVADFAADDTVKLENESVQFTDLSINNPVIWTWNFGDGNTSPLQNPTHNYSTTGDYTVTLTASNAYGSNTVVKTNYMHIGLVPIATFTADDQSILANDMVSFTDISANVPTSWYWDFGDGNTSTVQNPTHVYSVGGSYDVTLIATNMFGSDTLVSGSFIEVFFPPIPAFYANQTTVAGSVTIQFTDQSLNNPTSWLWDFGDGSTSTEQNPTYGYVTQGVYNISLTVTSGFGTNTLVMTNYISITSSFQVGSFAYGGVVAYILQQGDPGYIAGEIHGFVCDINNLPQSEWGCYFSLISGAGGTALGTGAQNTIDIVNANCSYNNPSQPMPIAANQCFFLSSNGYTDWFLPSRDELQKAYINRDAINITAINNGGSSFNASYNYWTSSQSYAQLGGSYGVEAWAQGFQPPSSSYPTMQFLSYKSHGNKVRAFRTF